MLKITEVLRDSVQGYFTTTDDDLKLRHFNKLVDICTSNAVGMFIPTRTVGIGLRGEKRVKDNLIHDLAEVFVLEYLLKHRDSGRFDFMPHAFKQHVMNKIRDISRSHEEDFVEMLPEEYQEDPLEG